MNRTFASLALLLLATGLSLGSTCDDDTTSPVERAVWENATFSADGSRVLQMAVVYTTTNPDAPYFNDPDAEGCCVRLRDTAADLVSDAHDYEFTTDTGSVDLSPLYAPLWWKPEDKLMVYGDSGEVLIRNLETQAVTSLRIPSELVPDLFDGMVDDEQGLVIDFVPSPDMRLVAVYYRLAVQDPDNPLLLSFYDAMAFFDFTADGTFVGATPVTYWQGDDEPLRLDPPLPSSDAPDLDPGETPPLETLRVLARPHYFLWSVDGQSLFIVDRGNDGEDNRVARLDVPSLRWTLLGNDDLVPGEPIATRGEGVRDDGLGLYVEESTSDPNNGTIITTMIEGWPGFSGRGLVPVSEIDYGL